MELLWILKNVSKLILMGQILIFMGNKYFGIGSPSKPFFRGYRLNPMGIFEGRIFYHRMIRKIEKLKSNVLMFILKNGVLLEALKILENVSKFILMHQKQVFNSGVYCDISLGKK